MMDTVQQWLTAGSPKKETKTRLNRWGWCQRTSATAVASLFSWSTIYACQFRAIIFDQVNDDEMLFCITGCYTAEERGLAIRVSSRDKKDVHILTPFSFLTTCLFLSTLSKIFLKATKKNSNVKKSLVKLSIVMDLLLLCVMMQKSSSLLMAMITSGKSISRYTYKVLLTLCVKGCFWSYCKCSSCHLYWRLVVGKSKFWSHIHTLTSLWCL